MKIGGMNKEILKISLNTENLSFLENHTHSIKLKNSTCGDEIKIYLIVKNKKITDFKYQGESCIYCQASASLLSINVKNKTVSRIEILLKQADNLFKNKKINSNKEWENFLKIMNKSNILRKECLLLPIKATLKALKN
jgi:NifU homolog involved in Fe-S cluster formation